MKALFAILNVLAGVALLAVGFWYIGLGLRLSGGLMLAAGVCAMILGLAQLLAKAPPPADVADPPKPLDLP